MEPAYFHPNALVESDKIGAGTKVWAFAHVMKGAEIGENCNVSDWCVVENGACVGNGVTMKYYVIVGEGVIVEDGAFIGPGVYLSNDLYPRSPRMVGVKEVTDRYESKDNWLVRTTVRRSATIGAKASIAPGATIGEFAMVAMGAVVTKDVDPYRLVAGVPARPVGWVCICGFPLHESGEMEWKCSECGRVYRLSAARKLELMGS